MSAKDPHGFILSQHGAPGYSFVSNALLASCIIVSCINLYWKSPALVFSRLGWAKHIMTEEEYEYEYEYEYKYEYEYEDEDQDEDKDEDEGEGGGGGRGEGEGENTAFWRWLR